MTDRQMTYWEKVFAKKKKKTVRSQKKSSVFHQQKDKKRNAHRDMSRGLELAITQMVNKDTILEESIAFEAKPRIIESRGISLISLETLSCSWCVDVLTINVCLYFPMACAAGIGFESHTYHDRRG